MSHIEPRLLTAGDLIGEITIDDYGVFLSTPSLTHAADFWDAMVLQAITLDKTYSEEIKAVQDALGSANPESDNILMLEDRLRCLTTANAFLVKSTIFSLLLAFVEYGLVEVYKVAFGHPPKSKRPKLLEDVVHPLCSRGIDATFPDFYNDSIGSGRDAVRNSLMHGRWNELDEASADVDLHDAFISVVEYFCQIEESLERQGIS